MIVTHNEHTIEIKNNLLTGKETILYDGKEVSSKRSIGGSTHIFIVKEDNEDIQYEVENSLRWHCMSAYTTMRRKGQIIYTNK
jgi:hypothetical protein